MGGGSKLWYRKDYWTLLRQITSPQHPPHPLPPVAVARYNSLAAYRLPGFYSYRMHPWNSLLLCLVTKIVQISSTSMWRSWCKCMSASPDNCSSDILFLRYDLIRRKQENERSASAELTGKVQPIINKTHMLGYISSSAYFTHSIRFPGSCKWVCTVFKSIAIPLTQKEERTV